MWFRRSDREAYRDDGAYIYCVFGPEKKKWVAVAPDRKTWLLTKQGRQRRWLNADGAMRILDTEFPPDAGARGMTNNEV